MASQKMSDAELMAQLNALPELRARFESILSVAVNADGSLEEADAAEARLIEEVRRLGQETLTAWGHHQAEASAATVLRTPGVRREGKKNSSGTARSAK